MSTAFLPLAGLPGSWEIWIILLVILLLFGSRIPKVARSLGQGISQFKKGLNEGDVDPSEAERRVTGGEKKSDRETDEES